MIGLVDAMRAGRSDAMAEEQARQNLALRLAQESRAAELHRLTLQEAQQRAEDAAALRAAKQRVTSALTATTPDADAIAAKDADFAAADALALAGRDVPKADPAVWGRPDARPNDAALSMAMQGLAAQSGDLGSVLALRDRDKAEDLTKARRAEFKRLNSMKDEELAAMHAAANADPNIPAKVTFDSKARQFIVSANDGSNPRRVNRGDIIAFQMSAWEAANGDMGKGMQGMQDARKDQRAEGDAIYKRSLELAKANESAWVHGNQADNQAAQLAISRGHLGVAQAAEGRHRAEFNAGAGEREAKAEIARLKSQLAKADDTTPEGREQIQKIQVKLQALATGTRGGGAGAGADPADVKKAQALVAAGVAPDLGTALELVISKPDKLHSDMVQLGLKEMLDPAAAVQRADTVMQQMGWARKGRQWTKGGAGSVGGKPADEAAAHAEARAAIAQGASKDAINARLKQWGFKPL